ELVIGAWSLVIPTDGRVHLFTGWRINGLKESGIFAGLNGGRGHEERSVIRGADKGAVELIFYFAKHVGQFFARRKLAATHLEDKVAIWADDLHDDGRQVAGGLGRRCLGGQPRVQLALGAAKARRDHEKNQ